MEHLASDKTEWRFVFDEEPPLGKKILMRLQFGGAIIGDYYKESQVVAWAPLPAYKPEQRRYLDGLISAGYDPTKHRSKQGETVTDFQNLERRILTWAKNNGILEGNDIKAQAMKFGEESGELFGALLRKDEAKIVDSYGDVLVTLVILSWMTNHDLLSCLKAAFDEIKNRKGQMRDGAFVKEEET